jgi:hypothetical protein
MVWGGWGEAEKSYASMCDEFLLFGREKTQENHQNHFLVCNTSNSSPILLLFPETLNLIFLENTKRRAPENDRDLSYQKLIWSHVMPFGVNSDPSFRAQKRRIRVRVSSFRTAGTVIPGGSPRKTLGSCKKRAKNGSYRAKKQQKTEKSIFPQKLFFFTILNGICEGLGVFRVTARTIGNLSLKLSQDLVLPNVGQVDFHDFRKYRNVNVLELALKTLRFVQGLSRTPLLFIPRYLTTRISKTIPQRKYRK